MDEKLTQIPETDEMDLGVVELTDDEGRILKFFHIGTIEFDGRWFAFFQPAEEIDGVEDEEVVIFEIVGDEGGEALAPVEDEDLLDEVYAAFIKEMEDDDEDGCGCGCGCGDEGCDDDEDCGCDKKPVSHCGCGCSHHDKK